MDRYTVELAALIVAVVWLQAYVIGPLLGTVHPLFTVPVTTMTNPDAPLFRWRYSINWTSPRLYLMVILEAIAVFSWAKWRRDELRENLREKYGLDVGNQE